eukprot:128449-Pleurochrysis_carterae.AAC.1
MHRSDTFTVADYSQTRPRRLWAAKASCFYDCSMPEPNLSESQRRGERWGKIAAIQSAAVDARGLGLGEAQCF